MYEIPSFWITKKASNFHHESVMMEDMINLQKIITGSKNPIRKQYKEVGNIKTASSSIPKGGISSHNNLEFLGTGWYQ